MRRFRWGCLIAVISAFLLASIVSPYQSAAAKPSPTPAWDWGYPTPSGVPMPVGDVTSNGHLFRQVVAEDFDKDAPSGSWANTSCADAVVYTGASGVPWMSYPSCWQDTWQHRPYQPGSVLSVHDGLLDVWLHPVNGRPAGANPSPVLPDGSSYQLYGRYVVRMRQTAGPLSDYYMAFLLWPQDGDYRCAESDFPERNLASANVWAFNHYCTNGAAQPATGFGKGIDPTIWHTYVMQWQPGQRLYSIDGISVGITYTGVYAGPERWQLQTETSGNVCEPSCTQEGHVLIDWAVVYSY